MLNAIYEEDFLGFRYGFRPGRGAHDALDALCVGIGRKKVNWILDADIRSFFDEISQEWLIRFLEHRIGDRRIIRLIQKWLKAGILEDGIVTVSDRGTGQGSVISPLLANIYLHYVLDLWAERWRRREATGDMIIVRYADDFIVGFQHEGDARRFLDEMRERLQEFALSLHPEKTRLIEFGRFAAEPASGAGSASRRPSTSWASPSSAARPAAGKFLIQRKTRRDRMRAKLRRSRRRCDGACTSRSPSRGNGWGRWSAATSTTMPCRPTGEHWGVPGPGHRPLAARAPASQPEGSAHLGADEATGRRLAPETAHPPSLAQRALCRHTPEVGAVCGKAARTVLCGGRSATSVPTATQSPRVHLTARRRGGDMAVRRDARSRRCR